MPCKNKHDVQTQTILDFLLSKSSTTNDDLASEESNFAEERMHPRMERESNFVEERMHPRTERPQFRTAEHPA